jgi:hypothetical protein
LNTVSNRPSFDASIALVRTRIAGFATLKVDDQLRAAAFALKRDLGVDTANVRLAARVLSKSDDVAVAFSSVRDGDPQRTLTCPAAFFKAIESGALHWFGAPHGVAVGPSGSAVIDQHSESELPNEIVTLLSSRGAPTRVVLQDAATTPTTNTLAHWSAASGATFSMATDDTFNLNERVTLVAPSASSITPSRSAFDRALAITCVASLVCLCAAGYQWFDHTSSINSIPATSPTANGKNTMQAGELFARVATVSPTMTASMKSATYGGGAWLIALSASPAAGPSAATKPVTETDSGVARLNGTASALRNNGFAVQAITEPEPRLRVQAP